MEMKKLKEEIILFFQMNMEWYILLGIIKQWLIKNFLVNILKKLILKKDLSRLIIYIIMIKILVFNFFQIYMTFEFDYNDLFEFPDDIKF